MRLNDSYNLLSQAVTAANSALHALATLAHQVDDAVKVLDGLHRLLGQAGAAINPALPESNASGNDSGVAMAAAAGLADVGIGIDHLSGPRVHASCITTSLDWILAITERLIVAVRHLMLSQHPDGSKNTQAKQ